MVMAMYSRRSRLFFFGGFFLGHFFFLFDQNVNGWTTTTPLGGCQRLLFLGPRFLRKRFFLVLWRLSVRRTVVSEKSGVVIWLIAAPV